MWIPADANFPDAAFEETGPLMQAGIVNEPKRNSKLRTG